jgi:hypothetical protein
MRKLCTNEVGGVKMKKMKKYFFSLLLSFGYCFGFALQRSFVELEKALLYHFKSLKMEKN